MMDGVEKGAVLNYLMVIKPLYIQMICHTLIMWHGSENVLHK